jgi:hypothetical protein
MNDENLKKEIDLIQGCISRMANNSFLLKGWAISIAAVVLALAEKNARMEIICAVVIVPLLSFWYLDAFFLRTERMYRKMYDWVVSHRLRGDLEYLFDLNPDRFSKNVSGIIGTMFSKTLQVFYGVPIVLSALIAFYTP